MGNEANSALSSLSSSLEDLQKHCCLVNAMLGRKIDESSLQDHINRCPKRSRERNLEKAISEAIETLEATRKAFKSKQLEMLRKKLVQTLIESE